MDICNNGALRMTYAQFLLVFLLPPIVGLALAQPRPLAGIGLRPCVRALGLVATAALLYTTPWDNFLVWRGVWVYGEERVLGVVGYVPVEEYLFFLLQPVLVGLVLFLLRAIRPSTPSPSPGGLRRALVGGWLLAAAVGAGLLISANPRLLYLGLILAWAAPVLAGMSVLGTERLWAERGPFVLTVAGVSAYLWVTDRTAIARGIWEISDRYSLGVDLLGLPVEEATFFFLTTWLCAQGLAMLLPERERVGA